MLATLSMSWWIAILTAVAAVLLALFKGGKKTKKREVLTAAARRWFAEYTRAKVGGGDLSPLSAGTLYSLYWEENGISPFENDPALEQLNAFLARQPY